MCVWTQDGTNGVQCLLCGNRFASVKNMIKHQEKAHADEVRQHKERARAGEPAPAFDLVMRNTDRYTYAAAGREKNNQTEKMTASFSSYVLSRRRARLKVAALDILSTQIQLKFILRAL